ncbi:hypothetical protein A2V71_00720 [Candidatus Berkelbacteria bacterium RBG_13_40_8]|uniref:LysM domain-containing protein n=1 Tax=Candidatus Berkelbacteria bacterium RBG_13_40_8 TaxID=1797467 RepID=A0A1F5DQ73_9BACT|nr:MAG: hypothetical protein A2V71_00720 [Candidatus Berkelbacteria bacterium RBG_13_40_8]
MNKQFKILFIVLLVVIGLLATSTGFFYAKTVSLQNEDKTSASQEGSKKITDTTATTTDTTAESSTPSAVTTPASLGSRPSSPSDTVTVKSGDTLFSIGQDVDVSWTLIAEANGITDEKIKVGESLIIPKNNQIGFTVNQEKAASLQKDVDAGKTLFRLSALDTAKSDSSPVYGIETTDNFTQDKIDETAGSATISVTHGDATYSINLIQPVTKGPKGIWAIESIKPAK